MDMMAAEEVARAYAVPVSTLGGVRTRKVWRYRPVTRYLRCIEAPVLPDEPDVPDWIEPRISVVRLARRVPEAWQESVPSVEWRAIPVQRYGFKQVYAQRWMRDEWAGRQREQLAHAASREGYKIVGDVATRDTEETWTERVQVVIPARPAWSRSPARRVRLGR